MRSTYVHEGVLPQLPTSTVIDSKWLAVGSTEFGVTADFYFLGTQPRIPISARYVPPFTATVSARFDCTPDPRISPNDADAQGDGPGEI